MKSVIVGKEKELGIKKYPCLKITKNKKSIVLFINLNTGYELHDEGNKKCELLYLYSNSWLEEDFELFDGKIELSN